jgi:molecular chaperone DnaJ
MSDFMRNHGMFADLFGGFNMHNMHNRQTNKTFNPKERQNGRDIRVNMQISFKQAINGFSNDFELKIPVECSKCNGTGFKDVNAVSTCKICNGTGMVMQQSKTPFGISITTTQCHSCNGTGIYGDKCPECNGNKRVNKTKTITVNIPKGIDNGQTIRIINGGECGLFGGTNGNLLINISITNDELFKRNNLDIYTKVTISPIDAMLGGKVKVMAPTGKYVDLTIPAGTYNNKELIIKNAGATYNNKTGNLIC